THDSMVSHDQNERDEKRDPVLVKHNDRQQYKEMEMHLDDASRQMHEQGCGYHQSDGCHGGPCVPAQNCETADAGNRRNGQTGGCAEKDAISAENSKTRDPYCMEPKQCENAAMALSPLLIGKCPSSGKRI